MREGRDERDLATAHRSPLAILVNPNAATVNGRSAQELSTAAAELGLPADVIAPRSSDEMCDIIRRSVAGQAARIAVAGGDGTVAAAARELAHTETALGIIPLGAANNFARALCLPRDVPGALRVIRDGTVRMVDLGRIGDHLFTEAAGVGIFADALAYYTAGGANASNQGRLLRALYSVTRVLFSLRAKHLRLSIDGKPYRERSVMCTVANTQRIALAEPVAPHAGISDGLLDVIVIGNLSRWEVMRYYQAIQAGTHLALPKVKSLQGKTVHIGGRCPMNVHCDDQVVGRTPATITVEHHALRILVGAN